MRQPIQPPHQGPPVSASSGNNANAPNEPYGVMPHSPTPSTSPYAAFAQQAPPPNRQQADYPYLDRGQAAVPTQPVAQHLSSVGQPANRIATDSTGADPYSTGPTASFPRYIPTPSPGPAPASPQRFTQPQPPGSVRQAAVPTSTPWRRDRIIALITTLIACGTLTTWTIIDASQHPSFQPDQGSTSRFLINVTFYILYTPGAWWLALIFLPVRAICKNHPSAMPAAATLQLFLIDVLIFNNSIINTPLPIMCLLATGGAAIATTVMSQHTPTPRPWPITLGLAVNLFILVSTLHRLTKTALYFFNDPHTEGATVGLWMVPSPSNEYPGTPYFLGILLMIITATLAAIALYVGHQSSHRSTFTKACGIAPAIVALHNIYILSAFGLSGSSVTSALGFTVIGQGAHPHAAFRAWCASILLGVITIGVIVMLHRCSSAGRRNQLSMTMPPIGAAVSR